MRVKSPGTKVLRMIFVIIVRDMYHVKLFFHVVAISVACFVVLHSIRLYIVSVLSKNILKTLVYYITISTRGGSAT